MLLMAVALEEEVLLKAVLLRSLIVVLLEELEVRRRLLELLIRKVRRAK
jgi:hypothetical protein